MRNKLASLVLACVFSHCASALLFAASANLTVRVDQPGAKINPAMWGIFFEDINLGADGGLYAELVKNRSFEFPTSLMGWKEVPRGGAGAVSVVEDKPFDPANPHFMRITSATDQDVAVWNEGFRGIGVRENETYEFSAQLRSNFPRPPKVRVSLTDAAGKALATTLIEGVTADWKLHTVSLQCTATDPRARLAIVLEGRGVLDLDMVSLFPKRTWKDRPGGLRADMVQLLADLKPGFLRFPGGCIVEGSHLDRRYQWKTTIGPVQQRKLIINRWNYEFRHRPTPDYFQSFGLGFFEFFQLCDDIGAEPLPILNCGMACQFNTGQLVPLDQLEPYIQDALDLIEFANGPATSPWGARRAAMGHPAPFNMKMLGVGNEQWGPQYIERYLAFAKVLKEKHPEIMLVSDAGPSPADDRFRFLSPKLTEIRADIVDEHCYANPIWFLANSHRYDHYDRKGPKIFMGEYAAQSVAIVSPDNQNNLDCALAEGAYMTGLERNADVVRMASYAPLFAHVDGWQWTPNLIWVDNLRACPTPNYFVQQLFTLNRGDTILPVELSGVEVPALAAGRIGLGTFQTTAEFKDVRVTRGNETLFSSDFTRGSQGWAPGRGRWVAADGVFQQTERSGAASTSAGNASWNDYTISLKARKMDGQEGFMITVRNNGPENNVAWNLGGFRNRFHSIQHRFAQQDHLMSQVPGSIETNRWYDVKVELKGAKVSCYLDGQLVQSVEVPVPQVQRLYASATRDDKAGEVILKVVNYGAEANEAQINLAGAPNVAPEARAIVLTGGSLADVNSLDDPRHVAPSESKVAISGARFTHTFPKHSMTVLRIPTR